VAPPSVSECCLVRPRQRGCLRADGPGWLHQAALSASRGSAIRERLLSCPSSAAGLPAGGRARLAGLDLSSEFIRYEILSLAVKRGPVTSDGWPVTCETDIVNWRICRRRRALQRGPALLEGRF